MMSWSYLKLIMFLKEIWLWSNPDIFFKFCLFKISADITRTAPRWPAPPSVWQHAFTATVPSPTYLPWRWAGRVNDDSASGQRRTTLARCWAIIYEVDPSCCMPLMVKWIILLGRGFINHVTPSISQKKHTVYEVTLKWHSTFSNNNL